MNSRWSNAQLWLSFGALTLVLTLGLPVRGYAQDLAHAIHVTAENDNFDFWRPPDQRSDDNYTQGARISADLSVVPSVMRRLVCRDHLLSQCATTLEIGQDIYTPTHDAVRLLPGQRPYAGWLYMSASTVAATERSRLTVGGIFGVTGSASLAAQTQTAFHRLVPRLRQPLGWAQQIPTEPDFAVRAEDDWYIAAPGEARRWIDFVPETHAIVGTLRTALGAGGRARVGFGLTHPWLVDATARSWEAYFFVGGQTEAVARDLFLDGSTFRRSAHVSREPLFSEWERGIGIRLWRIGLEYRVATQGREYRTGPAAHTFGGLTLSWWTVH